MTHSSSRPRALRAIVTGHTRGLGAALAGQLLERDAIVLGLSRKRHETLAARFAERFSEVELDLADPARVAQWLAGDTLRRFVDGADCVLLLNNAGTVDPIGPLPVQEAGAIAGAVALNVTAPLMLASALVTAAAGVPDRRVVHISSGAARNAYAGWSVYCATKAALDHHARAVTLDAGPALRICSLAPGVVDTDMQATIRSTGAGRFPLRERFEQMKTDGKLTSPEAAARQVIDYALSERFGSTPTADVRELAAG
ncbi:short-chain dehydrogenase [Burkholderia sp. WAC0059]|uniref:SDR family oxidoreductase n=1 Tax=Burkholderia sp. WAC0059 TaxID=2066022 RepID=UPI000C7F049D|nr:SDR family oxidoreductase [Burkholderia sp. WAC0059]PLZ03946.1 short-chain dehydrogenase [Burkholderia sp. WAC0059]